MSESGSKHVEAASEYHYVPQTTAPPAYQAHQPAHAASTTTSALPFNPADVAQLFRVPLTANRGSGKLAKCVALPQTKPQYDALFLRAWSPAFEGTGVTEPAWIDFLQGLDYCMSAGPPTHVVDLVEQGIGADAYHWSISAYLNAIDANLPNERCFTRSITDIYLAKANIDFFRPRGLRCRIMRGDALHKFIALSNPATTKAKSVASTSERIARNIPVPVVGGLVNMAINIGKGTAKAITASPPDALTYGEHAAQRLAPFHGAVAKLKPDCPWPAKPDILVDEASTLSLYLRQASVAKREAEEARRQQLSALQGGSITLDQAVAAQYDVSWLGRREMRRADRRQYKDLRRQHKRFNRDARRARWHGGTSGTNSHNLSMQSASMTVSQPVRMGCPPADHTLWLVVYPVEDDRWIKGSEVLDDLAAIHVSDEDFAEELELEFQEDVRNRDI